ncbi:CocE/NonD family hydrolase [Aeromicrobium panaciterrae]|uniref:CocE/NonD family hydrolase n=1 Tax=Aeromicrobium panaciterrae TaxID=363861 RepID=UPI0031D52482
MKFTFEQDVLVPMSDGTTLAMDVWMPDGSGPFPVLLGRGPYGKSHQGNYAEPEADHLALLAAGYAYVLQDSRGTGMSEGQFTPFVDEARDGADTIRWLIEQEWCDGSVAMVVGSYGAYAQWAAASTGVEGLRAITPLMGGGDFHRAPWYSPGGAMSLDSVAHWSALMAMGECVRKSAQPGEDGGDPPKDVMDDMAGLGALLSDSAALVRVSPVADQPLIQKYLPWAAEVVGRPDYDSFWEEQAVDKFDAISIPALNVGGWYDFFIGEVLHSYVEMRKRGGSADARSGQRLIVGPWTHSSYDGMHADRQFGVAGAFASAEVNETRLKFLNRWLRGQEDALEGLAPVRIFVMGLDQWREEQDWPLPDTQYTDYYLTGTGPANTADGDGRLTVEPLGDGTVDTYLYDPRRPVKTIGGTIMPFSAQIGHDGINGPADQSEIESRDDVLVFSTPVLTEPVEATGPISLTLHVSSSAPDTDFTGKLVDVFPDGRAIILCEGIQRMRYRNSASDPEMMEPGEIYEVVLDLNATSNVFLPGHQIRLEVSSSNFPRYDRNSNTGGVISSESEEEMVVAVNRVHRGGVHASRLTLPIIRRAAEGA